jgi:putative transposase
LSRTMSIAGFVKEVKRVSSGWLRSEKGCRSFHWQAGYGAFSVSASKVDAVRAYIENQKEHHSRMTFKDEFRGLLEKHGVGFDESYVWD